MNLDAENRRIEILQNFDILDTPPDGTFDHIVKLLAEMLDMPIALVTLVDTDRIWFKAKHGLGAPQISKEDGVGLCSSAILSDEFYMISDMLKDPRTKLNSLVNSSLGLRFYAAAPLTTKDGYNLGTLCVLDKKPRNLKEEHQQILTTFSQIIVNQLEVRLEARNKIENKSKLENIFAHDVLNDLSFIPKLVEKLKENNSPPDEMELLLNMIAFSASKSIGQIENFIQHPSRI